MGKYKINTRTGKFDLVGNSSGIDIDIVTEQENGLESSLDKKLSDHSYNNIMILEKTFQTAKEASDYLCSLDPQYYPVAGQMMQYTDKQGEKHIVRYNGSYLIRRDGVKKKWGHVMYDELNDCYIAVDKDTTSIINYGICYNSGFWNIHELKTQTKYWRFCGTDPILGSAFVAGNSAREVLLSKDAFKTHTAKSWSSGYHRNIKGRDYNGERCWIDQIRSGQTMSVEAYSDDGTKYVVVDDLQSLINSLHDNVNCNGLGAFELRETGSHKDFFIVWNDNYTGTTTRKLSWVRDYTLISTIELGTSVIYEADYINGYIYCYAGGLGSSLGGEVAYIVHVDDNNMLLSINRTINDCHSLLLTSYGLVELYHTKIKLNGEDIELPVELGDEQLISMAWNRRNHIMVITGNHNDNDARTGNMGLLLDLTTKKIVNLDQWEEVPVIPDGIEGMIVVRNNKVEQCQFGENVYVDVDGKLCVKSSDRNTEYKNFMLETESYGVNGYDSLWCKIPYESIAEGVAVYIDEDCTTQLTTIKRCKHNINNPYDVVVSIDGQDLNYNFLPSKVPLTLATTKAVLSVESEALNLRKSLNELRNTTNSLVDKAEIVNIQSPVSSSDINDYAFCVSDPNGNIVLAVTNDGYPVTQNFNGKNISLNPSQNMTPIESGVKRLILGEFNQGTYTSGTSITSSNNAIVSDIVVPPYYFCDLLIHVVDGYKCKIVSGYHNKMNQSSEWITSDAIYTLPTKYDWEMRVIVMKNDGGNISPEESSAVSIRYNIGYNLIYELRRSISETIQQSNNGNNAVLFHISDLHGDNIRLDNCLRTAEHIGADAVINTGDIVAVVDMDGCKPFIETSIRHGAIPQFLCVGNHESYYHTDYTWIYNFMFSDLANIHGYMHNSIKRAQYPFYFKDIADKQLRIIALDQYNVTSTQINWLCETLINTPSGYGIILMYHEAEYRSVQSETAANFFCGNSTMLTRSSNRFIVEIIDKFISRTTYNSYDFSLVPSSVEFIAHCNGHDHNDWIGYVNSATNRQVQLNCNCGIAFQSYDQTNSTLNENSDLLRTPGDPNENCFNAYVIDRQMKEITIIRFGAIKKKDNSERFKATIKYR